MFLCQTTIPSGREFRTRQRGGDGTSCEAGAKSQVPAALRANPNPAQAALAAVAPRAPEAAGNELNNRAIICGKRESPIQVRQTVSNSSARTTKRFPSSRCASAIQSLRPSESRVETQPQLQLWLVQLLHHRRQNRINQARRITSA